MRTFKSSTKEQEGRGMGLCTEQTGMAEFVGGQLSLSVWLVASVHDDAC